MQRYEVLMRLDPEDMRDTLLLVVTAPDELTACAIAGVRTYLKAGLPREVVAVRSEKEFMQDEGADPEVDGL